MDLALAPSELLAFFTPEDLARGAERAWVVHTATALDLLLDVVLLWLLAFGALGRRLHDACERLAARMRPGPLTRALGPAALGGALFLATVPLWRALVSLPVVLWADHFHAHAIGLSHEPLARWLGRFALATFIASIAFGVLGAGLGAVRRRWPRRWWLSVGLAGAMLLVVDAAAQPYWMRLTYRIQPLEAGPLREQIEALIQSQNASPGELAVVDQSRIGTATNAWVTGFGPTRRLVLTDTLVALGPDAVLGAVAHELGHRRDEKMPGRLALAGGGLVLFLWLVERALRWAIARGARSEGQSVPFVLLGAMVLGLVVSPVRAAFGRAEERAADDVELRVRRDLDAYIADQVRHTRARAADPAPGFVARMLSTHPGPSERIARALWYKRERSAETPAAHSQ